jgi:hypothetical protein
MIDELQQIDNEVVALRYKDLEKLGSICRSCSLPVPPESLDRRFFRGGRIHSHIPLATVHAEKGLGKRFRERIPAAIWNRVPALSPRSSGSLCVVNEEALAQSANTDQQRRKNRPSLTVGRHTLLDDLQSKIFQKMKNADWAFRLD